MVVLSDRDVRKLIEEGKIVIEPVDLEKQLMPVGIDLRLGNEFRIFRISYKSHIDPSKDGIVELTELVHVNDGEPFIIHPGEFVLGVTKEYIKLPNNIMARIDGRSSLGRLGIVVHSTAGHVDPGFEGKLTLEITNIGKLPVALFPGMKFCSLIFEKISSPVEREYKKFGKYAGQKLPTESKIALEFQKK